MIIYFGLQYNNICISQMATKRCLRDLEHEARARARSARVLSGLNRIETPIGRHLSVIDPNPFAYPIISPSSRFLTGYA